ncbi:cell division topological specificity factor [bacterium BMS3Bbin10]|nr:cell division topological specificity factor [bacterium BMS3Bbin10]
MKMFALRKRRKTSDVARERIQILLAHERGVIGSSDLIATLRNEILVAVAKYVPVEIDQVDVKMDRGATLSTLQIDIEFPVISR